MRIEAEHAPAAQLRRAVLDDADVAVAVLDGCRKVAGLKRRAHALVLAARHLAAEYERFGPAADAAEQRADQRLVRGRRRQGFRPNLAAAGLGDPERARLSGGLGHFVAGQRGLAAPARAYLQTGRQACKRHRLCPSQASTSTDRSLPAQRWPRGAAPAVLLAAAATIAGGLLLGALARRWRAPVASRRARARRQQSAVVARRAALHARRPSVPPMP